MREDLLYIHFKISGYQKRMSYVRTTLEKFGFTKHLPELNPLIQKFSYSNDDTVDTNIGLLIGALNKIGRETYHGED